MQMQHNPTVNPRYWFALALASIFGCNLGDFASRVLGLGHWRGLLPLALIFGAILLAERRVPARTQAFYWLAILVFRTAATNLGDLLAGDFKINVVVVMAALAALLAAIVVTDRTALRPQSSGTMPETDARYWSAMLVAGTLGTVLGDVVGDGIGLGISSVIFLAVLAAMLFLRGQAAFTTKAFYWATIVIVRTMGTNVGDFVAGRHGLALGLVTSTVVTGAAFVVALLLWRERSARVASAAGD